MQGAWIPSLVRELRSQMLQLRPGVAKWTHIKKHIVYIYFGPVLKQACGFLVPQRGFWPESPALAAQNLNYWTSREVSKPLHLKRFKYWSENENDCLCGFLCHWQILLLNHCIHLVNQRVDFSHQHTENISVRGSTCFIWTKKLRINCSSDLSAGIAGFCHLHLPWFFYHNMLGVTMNIRDFFNSLFPLPAWK